MTIALIALALAGQTAFAGKLMKFSEVQKCVSLDHEIIAEEEDLMGLKADIDARHGELIAMKTDTDELRARAEKEKVSGNTEAYNRIVGEYNKLMAEYEKKRGIYDKLSSKYTSMEENLTGKKDSFVSGCDNRRIFKPDLKKACRESPHPDTPFCTGNIKD